MYSKLPALIVNSYNEYTTPWYYKTTPYEVVFGIKPSSEPVSALTVIDTEDAQDAGSEWDSSDMEENNNSISEGEKTCM